MMVLLSIATIVLAHCNVVVLCYSNYKGVIAFCRETDTLRFPFLSCTGEIDSECQVFLLLCDSVCHNTNELIG